MEQSDQGQAEDALLEPQSQAIKVN
jgi:hypothetical protein